MIRMYLIELAVGTALFVGGGLFATHGQLDLTLPAMAAPAPQSCAPQLPPKHIVAREVDSFSTVTTTESWEANK